MIEIKLKPKNNNNSKTIEISSQAHYGPNTFVSRFFLGGFFCVVFSLIVSLILVTI